jgi:hypothetical protein
MATCRRKHILDEANRVERDGRVYCATCLRQAEAPKLPADLRRRLGLTPPKSAAVKVREGRLLCKRGHPKIDTNRLPSGACRACAAWLGNHRRGPTPTERVPDWYVAKFVPGWSKMVVE